MADIRFQPETQYLLWPDVNVFPLSVNGSDADALRQFQNVTFLYVMPAFSLLGFLGNVTSIHVLRRQDLTKCSNFLVLCLAVADMTYLVGTNNIPIHLYDHGDGFGFRAPPTMAIFLFAAFQFQRSLEFISKVLSLILPCFITFDRLLAVFIPLTFRRVLTPRRVRLGLAIMLLSTILANVVTSLKFGYQYSVDPATKEGVGFMVRTKFINDYSDVYLRCLNVTLILYGPLTIVFTTTGCLLIGVKVKIQANKRLRLIKTPAVTSLEKSTTKFRAIFKIGALTRISLRTTGPSHRTSLKRHEETAILRTLNQTSSSTRELNRQPSPVLVRSVSSEDLEGRDASNNTKLRTLNVEPMATTAGLTCISEVTGNYDTKDLTRTSGTTASQTSVTTGRPVVTGTKRSNKNHSKFFFNNRSTRTLLSVCMFYTVANAFNFIVIFFFNPSSLDFHRGLVVEVVRKLVLVINSTSNFLIYVIFHRKFRQTYMNVFCWCFKRHSN